MTPDKPEINTDKPKINTDKINQYIDLTKSEAQKFYKKISGRKNINQRWDFSLTLAGIALTVLVTILGSVDLKVDLTQGQEPQIKTAVLSVDARYIRLGIVCLGAMGVGIQSIIAAYPVRRKSNEYREIEAEAENLISMINHVSFQQELKIGHAEYIKKIGLLQEELRDLRIQAATIEANPALADIGLRFDQLLEKLDQLDEQNTAGADDQPPTGDT